MASGWLRGVVKAVPSADTLLIMGSVKSGPPPEKTVTLAGILAPKLARRDGSNKDEPFAWHAREYLRRKLIGQSVTFRIDYAVPTIGREFGTVYLDQLNVALDLVEQGWAKVRESRDGGSQMPAGFHEELVRREEAAKEEGRGLWSKDPDVLREAVRTIPPPVGSEGSNFDAMSLLQTHKGLPLAAVIENVRDGSFLRAWLLPDFQYVSFFLAGIQCPSVGRRATTDTAAAMASLKVDDNGDGAPAPAPPAGAPLTSAQRLAAAENREIPAEPFALQAKHFAETRVLHRDVRVVLEGVDKFQNLSGSLFYPDGDVPRDLAEELLKAGLAKCVDWSMNMLPLDGRTKLRAAERAAKQARLCLWRDYVPPPSNSSAIRDDQFAGKVVEIVSGDTLVVLDKALPPGPGAERRVVLSSIRAPKMGNARREERPAPFAREAKEFLRSRLIGKEVHVRMEYTRKVPAGGAGGAESAADRDMAFGSVYLPHAEKENGAPASNGAAAPAANGASGELGSNVAEMLVQRGLATVVRHRESEERSLAYDGLLAAEAKAQKEKRGLHSSKEPPLTLMNDVSLPGNANRAKAFLPFFQRNPRAHAIVDYVLSGHRYKLIVPKESCSIAFSLSGVRCPGKEEAFSAEATGFVRQRIMQHDVEVEIETVDKTGTFLGTLYCNKQNIGLLLLQQGLASLHPSFSPDRIPGGQELAAAEAKAKAAKLNLWKNWTEPVLLETAADADGPAASRGKDAAVQVRVSEVVDAGNFFVQRIDVAGKQLPSIEAALHALDLDSALPPVTFEPKKNEFVLAQFSADNSWARAVVDSVTRDASGLKGNAKYDVFYVDYGNRESVSFSRLRPMDATVASFPSQCQPATLAYLKVPSLDDDFGLEAAQLFNRLVAGKDLTARIEETDKATTGRRGPKISVILQDPSTPMSINASLLQAGLARVEKIRGSGYRAQESKKLLEYQEAARTARLHLWQYGDVDSDEEDRPPLASAGRGRR